jgi:hypothetical protein
VLSSEWDYLPFSTPSVFGDLAGCTFVGLPVIEAGNALIMPLACHELGHAVWRTNKLDSQITHDRRNALSEAIVARQDALKEYMDIQSKDHILQQLLLDDEDWARSVNRSSKTICEEIFCDMLGVRIFGMSYLYAFAYLTAPTFGDTDLQDYPALDARARFMVEGMKQFGIAPTGRDDWPGFPDFESRFMEARPKLEEFDRILLEAIHEACELLVPRLRDVANAVCGARPGQPIPIPLPTLKSARRAQRSFERGLPTTGSLPELVNGGWLGYLDPKYGGQKPAWQKNKFGGLNQLILKSLDVTEYENRQAEYEKRQKNASQVRQAG